MSAGERSGWRDADMSRRHRRYGFDCPGVDLDFVVVEYHLALPVAIMDYKPLSATSTPTAHPNTNPLCGSLRVADHQETP